MLVTCFWFPGFPSSEAYSQSCPTSIDRGPTSAIVTVADEDRPAAKRVGTAVTGVTPTGNTSKPAMWFRSEDFPELTRPKTAISKADDSSRLTIMSSTGRYSTRPQRVMTRSRSTSVATLEGSASRRAKRPDRSRPSPRRRKYRTRPRSRSRSSWTAATAARVASSTGPYPAVDLGPRSSTVISMCMTFDSTTHARLLCRTSKGMSSSRRWPSIADRMRSK